MWPWNFTLALDMFTFKISAYASRQTVACSLLFLEIVFTKLCMHLCTRIWTYAHTLTLLCAHTYVLTTHSYTTHTCVRILLHFSVHTHTHTHTHSLTHSLTHTRTHTHVQGRLFSYPDTHRHRVGPNYNQIPVNRPRGCTYRNYQRDGPMCFDDNQGW